VKIRIRQFWENLFTSQRKINEQKHLPWFQHKKEIPNTNLTYPISKNEMEEMTEILRRRQTSKYKKFLVF
jgi:hypothetical protein